jgi:hypothetical protein
MPSSIGAKSAGSARLTRQEAVAGPVRLRPDAVLAPPQPSTVTITEATVPLSTPMVETATFPDAMIAESEPSGFATAEPISPTSRSMEETVARLTALAEILSEQVEVLQQQMSVLQTEADTSREEAAGLLTRVADLESFVMRQFAAETPVEKMWDQKKNPSTTKGDVLSRRSRSMRNSSLAGAISEDKSSSGEEKEFAFPPSHPRGARVPGLTEQVTRRPEFKQLVSYRTYRLLDVSQGVD